jgi:hypothetical protein
MTSGYLQHSRDWTITPDAIVRLSARLGEPFTYADLAKEIEETDGLKVEPRGYAGALNAVAGNIASTDPMWTVMVVNADTREPGEGFWQADYPDIQYRVAATLSEPGRLAWLRDQQQWCVAAARSILEPLDQGLRDEEQRARDLARASLVEQMLKERRAERPE